MKEKKGNAVVIVLLVILLIVSIGVSLFLWMKLSNKESEINLIKNDLNTIKEQLKEKESITSNESIDTDSLNKVYSKKILRIIGSGASDAIYLSVIKDIDEEITNDDYHKLYEFEKTTQNGVRYTITDTKYSEYEKILKDMLTDNGIASLFSKFKYGNNKHVISINDMAAVAEYGWSGSDYKYKSQKLVGNIYKYEVTYLRAKSADINTEYDEETMYVIGKIVEGKYKIDSIDI